MTSLLNKAFQLQQRQVFVQQKRFRGKINIQRPRPPHYEKARVLALVQPFFKDKYAEKSPAELCRKQIKYVAKEEPVNPFQQILAREVLNWFKNSKMVAFYHQNPITAGEKFNLAVPLKKANMYIKQYGRATAEMGLRDTEFEPALKLFQSQTVMVFSAEQQVEKLMKLTRKTPQLVLMAGIVEGKLLSRNEFVDCGKLGDLMTVRAGLVQVLRTTAGGRLNQQLTHHQSTLVQRLQQIASNNSPSEET